MSTEKNEQLMTLRDREGEVMIIGNKGAVIKNCNIYGDKRKIVLRKHGKIKNCTILPDVEVIDGRARYIKLWRRLFDKQALY